MRLPRFSISTFMAVVLVLAVNLAAGDFYYGAPGMEWSTLINFGARPMASILAVGLLPLTRMRTRQNGARLFVIGFEVIGVGVLLFYVACAGVFTQTIHDGVAKLLTRLEAPGNILFPWSLIGLLLLPQLFAAWLGGWLHTRYRVSVRIERRQLENIGLVSRQA